MSKIKTALLIIGLIALAVILNGLVVAALLWVVNHFWDAPAWLALTKRNVIAFTVVIVLVQMLFGNGGRK